MKFHPFSNPLLIVGDNPALPGGLSRICRDLATLACTLPEFRVGVLGRGISNRRKFPFVLYDFPETMGWGEDYLQQAWEDFSEGADGIILTTDDPSRRHWFANPKGLPPELQKFLGTGRNFKKWGYFPIDSVGPGGNRLSLMGADTISKYDRVLTASEWGSEVAKQSGRSDCEWLPHGYFREQFHPVENAKKILGWDGRIVVGAVMANQSRKDFPVLFQTFAMLRQEYGNKFLGWLHTDVMVRYWDVYALAADYGIADAVEVSLAASDTDLSVRYSGCDCTTLPTGGEGFGYPIMESLACGTACVTTDYAAGVDLVDKNCLIPPVTYRLDTQHNVQRAVLSPYGFVRAIQEQVEKKQEDWDFRSGQLEDRVSHLEWDKLRHLWSKWLLGGLR